MLEKGKNKRFALTTGSSFIFQIITIISGFILPILRLKYFGSEVNGLVVSITQFLGLISFLDLGVGQVIQANLYKPLAEKDYGKASDILISGKKFFRTLALILIFYSGALAILYPFLDASQFGYWYIFSLVLILSIDSFMQYYFGISYQLLLNSDQKGYVQYNLQIITVIINLFLSASLIVSGFGIHAVKLVTSFVYLIRPLGMWLYVKKNYIKINLNKTINYEPIKQKWNGFAQHMASVVLNNTDVVVLTIFSSLNNVSVYAVYNLVVTGIKQLFTSLIQGIQPILGEYWAKKDYRALNRFFGYVEWTIHTGTIFIFGCTAILIVPFVKVYTQGITDYNYINLPFGILLTAAHAAHCIRLPYNLMAIAGGKFKETQSCHVIAAILNVILSIVMVYKFGLVGVAIGTLVAMSYQTIWLVIYLSNNLIKWDIKKFVKQCFIDILSIFIGAFISLRIINYNLTNYNQWVILALKVSLIWLGVITVLNVIFNKNRFFKTINIITKKVKNMRKTKA